MPGEGKTRRHGGHGEEQGQKKVAQSRKAETPLQASERVCLRSPREDDGALFLKAVKASRRLHKPWVSPPQTKGDFQKWLDRSRLSAHFTAVVCRVEDDEVVGVFELSQMVLGRFRSAYMSYFAMAGFS